MNVICVIFSYIIIVDNAENKWNEITEPYSKEKIIFHMLCLAKFWRYLFTKKKMIVSQTKKNINHVKFTLIPIQ